ncbi:MAG: polysaccharide biosynthesis/export family protein [Flavobacteriales bacterium]|nr:polysaccharide biosynthesis/export family protein [Flavobacteriales bacterium]
MLLSSCDRYLMRGFMLRTEPGYEYAQFDGLEGEEYRISPNDRVMVRIFANDGFDMVNVGGGAGMSSQGSSGASSSGAGSSGGSGGLLLQVEFDGFVKMPIAGRVYIAGLTARQAEMLLEDWLTKYINKPFVLLEVMNRRVMLFAGANTQVITLQEENTTLFEVLARAGGIPEDGKADKIKLIRGDLKNPEVFVIDLSTLKGVQNADLVMQANDIIYIELRKNYVTRTMAELAPYLALLTFAISTPVLIISLLK